MGINTRAKRELQGTEMKVLRALKDMPPLIRLW